MNLFFMRQDNDNFDNDNLDNIIENLRNMEVSGETLL